MTQIERRRRRRTRLLPLLVLFACLVAAGTIVALVAARADGPPAGQRASGAAAPTRGARRDRRPLLFVERSTGSLTAPVQDAAAVALGGDQAMLLGGLSAADRSRTEIRIGTAGGDRAAGQLPTALHDTAAVRLGGGVYVFGGGTGANTQSDEIVRVPAAGGVATIVGRLPAPSSDQAAAAIGSTAYVVGGYTGSRWLDTIVAWKPGSAARVVAHLPFPLRYAAVAAVDGRLVIAGGSLENGAASDIVLEYMPAAKHVARVGRLPAPTTHAAAAVMGGLVYVIGGRGAAVNAPTGRVVAFDVRTKRVRAAGSLSLPRSDLAAVPLGNRILLVGGRSAAGTEPGLSELVASAGAEAAQPARGAMPATPAGNVYAYDSANRLTGAALLAKPLIYVPNSQSDTVDVIDPRTYRVVDRFPVGGLPQHVVPSWNLRTLYVTNDHGNSLTPIDPQTGKPGAPIPVADPYNLYFTPDGRFAIVVAERLRRLDFRDSHSFRLDHSLSLPCAGVDHMDFTADGRYLLASCEFSGQMVEIDVARQRVVRTIDLPDGRSGMPQDVKLSPDGRIFYVADLHANGVWEIDARSYRVIGFLATGAGTHGLYPSRDARLLYVTNRSAGTVSVVSFRSRKVVATWRIPGGGSPDMGGVSADGKVLWLTGRYNAEVYAISTRNGRLLARIPVGAGPHGLCVWPQPGRYSLGHTGILR
ncbi:MAG: YVTN family beta-propeller repeat protein [Solirubrobacteraceae bacterium]